MKRTLLILLALCPSLLAQTTGQWELRKKTASGMQSYGITAVNGQAIGFTGGIPAMLPITASAAWADITGKPSTFPPEAHNQDWSTLTSTPTTLAGYGITDALTAATAASTYALINHNQAISTITGLQTALDAKAPLASPTFTGSVTIPAGSITASQIAYSAGGDYVALNGSGLDVVRAGATHGSSLVFPPRSGSLRQYLLPDLAATSITLLDTATAAATYITPATAAATYQPLDSDLTAIAALTTNAFGRSLLSQTSGNNVCVLIGAVRSTTPTLGGSLTIDNLNGNTFTFQTNNVPAANRTLEMPDADGFLAVTSNADGSISASGITTGTLALARLAQSSATSGQVIAWNGTAWAPATAASGATLAANTFTGLQQFSGTTHAGLRLNNLSTTQRDALASPSAGMVIWNTTDARMQLHNGTAWTSGMVRLTGDTMTGQLLLTQGSITSSAPLSITQTWNSGTPGTGAFSMLTLNATLTNASSTSSGFLSCIRDGTTRLFIDSGGTSYFGGGSAGSATLVVDTNNINVSLRNSANLDWMGDTKLYRLAAGVIAPRAANSTTGAAIEFLEQTAPAAPSADRVRIFAQDNGSGKTQLLVRWSDGTTTVLATQP